MGAAVKQASGKVRLWRPRKPRPRELVRTYRIGGDGRHRCVVCGVARGERHDAGCDQGD
jgi:hypothetical protein